MSETEDALRALSTEYASAIDRRDRPALMAVFTEDAELMTTHPGDTAPRRHIQGREALGDITQLIQRYTRTFHFLGNMRYTVDGDRATGEVYCTAHHLWKHLDAITNYVMLIRYLDTYVRADGRWQIAKREVQVDATEAHVALSVMP